MQQLFLAGDLYEKAVNGEKGATCRTNHRQITCGPMRLVNVDNESESITVEVHTIKWTAFHRLTEEDILHESDSQMELFDDMKRFYPEFDWCDHVTFIAWGE